MRLSHFVVELDEQGFSTRHPMKQWLRENYNELSADEVSSQTSHQIRRFLQNRGWRLEEVGDETHLYPPDYDFEQDVKFDEATKSEKENVSEDELSFELEQQLQQFLASNLSLIEVGESSLRLFEDGTGRSAIEYPTGVGFIDILAEDAAGNLYVIELKRAKSPDQAVGQVARYMGWLKHNGFEDRKINGIIVAKNISEKLKYALEMVPDVKAFEYEISFSLKRSLI